VSPVKYELGFYIPEDGILHSHRRENLKSDCCAVAQEVSRWLFTAAARFRSCEVRGEQSDTGAGSVRVLRFPLPLIHSTNCSTIITVYHTGPVQ
jgi:hypothetical protein